MPSEEATGLTSEELLARSQQNAAIARRYLDRVAPQVDPIFDLPLAVQRYVRKKPPELLPHHVPTCPSVARFEQIHQGYYQTDICLRYQVRCRLSPGHEGVHIYATQWERPGKWSVWEWPNT